MSADEPTRVDRVSVTFPRRERPVLDAVSAEFPAGTSTLVLGPSGSGKSTLLNLLTGAVPRSITSHVTGRVVRPALEQLGFLGQDPAAAVCLPTVEQELALVLEGAAVDPALIDARIDAALASVGAARLRHRHAAELSGGELQRVGLATACVDDPELLVLDEPTSMLDPAGVAAFRDVLARTAGRHTTTVVVEHRLDELAGPAGVHGLPERALALDEAGRVVASGPTAEVLHRAGDALHRAGNWLPLETELVAVGGVRGGLDAAANLALLARHGSPQPTPALGDVVLSAREVAVGRPGQPVISGVDLDLRRGELVALIGANGVGKTTLLLTLAGLLPPLSGHLGGAPPAMAFQNPEHQFVAGSVTDEVAFKVPDVARVPAALAQFRLTHLADANPFRLSGGEKRRLSLAANVVHDRDVLLADEPTFGLDRRDARATMLALRAWADAGRAVLFACHDLRQVATHADRVVVLGERGVLDDAPAHRALGRRPLPPLLAALGELVGPAEAAGVLSWLDTAPTRVPA